MELKDKSAIVTGSTKGIGLAIAHALSKEGVNVTVSGRRVEGVEQAVRSLSAVGQSRVSGKTCDVRRPEEVRELIDFSVSTFGGLDILINNAGIGIFKSVGEMQVEEWRDTLATNLDSLFYACHYALPALKKRGGGFIINIGSLAGRNTFPNGSAYNASKFGLIGFSEALMEEVRYDRIRVAYLMPGSVDTSFSGPGRSADWKLTAEDVAEVVIETLRRHPRCLTSRIEMRPSQPPRK